MENAICRSNCRLLLVLIIGSMSLSAFASLFNQTRGEMQELECVYHVTLQKHALVVQGLLE